MSTTARDFEREMRAMLEPLSWAERFECLAQHEKATSAAAARGEIVALRGELAGRALAELSQGWGGIPFKEGVLRLPSKRMRGALTRAAKEARNRRIVEVMTYGGAPLDGPMDWAHRFAQGLDERAVEMPLALASARLQDPGEVLDAGSALNLPVVREIVGRPAARVTHFTLPGSNEPMLPGDSDRFVRAFGDLRALPYPSAAFDRVVCVSTLEHVGMDTTRFGPTDESSTGDAAAAVSELLRVLRPGGTLLSTVPYGRAAGHGWFRILDAPALDELFAPAAGERLDTRYFYYDAGWAEDGPVPPPPVTASAFSADVITGVAVVRTVKRGATL